MLYNTDLETSDTRDQEITWCICLFIDQSREITWDLPLTDHFLEVFSWEIVTTPDKYSAFPNRERMMRGVPQQAE